jgi:hypothetical protein
MLTTTAATRLEHPDVESDADTNADTDADTDADAGPDPGPDTGVGEIKTEVAATGESTRALCGSCVGVLDMGDSTVPAVRTSRRTTPNVSASEQ